MKKIKRDFKKDLKKIILMMGVILSLFGITMAILIIFDDVNLAITILTILTLICIIIIYILKKKNKIIITNNEWANISNPKRGLMIGLSIGSLLNLSSLFLPIEINLIFYFPALIIVLLLSGAIGYIIGRQIKKK